MMNYWGFGVGGLIIAMGSMIVFWGLVIAGVVFVVRSVNGSRQPARHQAEEVLALRLARGEIDEVTYQRLLEALRRNAH